MNQDIGTTYVSDDDDSLPSSPLNGREQQDFSIPIKLIESTETKIVLSETEVYDDENYLISTFDDVLTSFRDDDYNTFLALSTGLYLYGSTIIDGESVNKGALVDWEYDNDNEIWTIKNSITYIATITAINDDTLTCSLSDEEITVNKPYALQKTPFDGESIEYDNGDTVSYSYDTYRRREATLGGDSEYQVITPDYWVDEEILITKISNSYYDLNQAGRQWAKEA